MKFKLDDKVFLREDSYWNNGGRANPSDTVGTIDRIEADTHICEYGVMWSNGVHNCCYEDDDLMLATEETPTLSNFTQEDYDEMCDRIELLESLLVDANKRIEDLEYSHDVRNNPLIMEFFRLTRLVSANREIAGLIGVEFGDNIVDKVCDYLLNAVNNK